MPDTVFWKENYDSTVSSYDHPVVGFNGTTPVLSRWASSLRNMPLQLTLGRNCRSKNWRLVDGTAWQGAHFLSHPQSGPKDGLMVMAGSLNGLRKRANDVVSVTALILDCDCGNKAKATSALQSKGRAFVLYPSHSDGKTTTILRRSDFEAFASREAAFPVEDVVKAYLLKVSGYSETVVYGAVVRKTSLKDDLIVVDHPPVEKFRVVMPLSHPIIIAECGGPSWFKPMWTDFVCETAADVGISIDPGSSDMGRAFYTPRTTKPERFEAVIGGVDPLVCSRRPRLAQVRNSTSRSTKPKSRTESSVPHSDISARHFADNETATFIRTHGHEFMLHKYLTDVRWTIRYVHEPGRLTIECPNDAMHSNPGDKSDRACLALDPSASDVGRAVITCRHAHCRGLTTADFLQLIKDSTHVANN